MNSRNLSVPVFLAALAIAAFSAAFGGFGLYAAEPAPEAPTTGILYVSLAPTFVTNYDGGGRLKYLKTDISLRVQAAAAVRVSLHLPYLRNRLVVLFSSQLEENLTSTEGKETLRMQALQEIRTALGYVDQASTANAVTDLYFTTFVVQR